MTEKRRGDSMVAAMSAGPVSPPAEKDKSPALRTYLTRRRKKRDGAWPDAEQRVFNPKASGGWARMPRTVPMISGLVDFLSDKEKPGRLYTVLWGYEYGDGLIEISDPAHLALEAGYLSSRAERSFNERMKALVKLGFIEAKPIGSREYGLVLLLDPHRVVVALKAMKDSRVPESWWTAFTSRCADIGIDLALYGVGLTTLALTPATTTSHEDDDDVPF